MPAADEADLVALDLPRPEAAAACVAAWDRGEAVAVLDPVAPGPERDRVLAALRPTVLVDGSGRRSLAGGVPVPAGVAAVTATSGTSGEPKPVELTREGLAASARLLGVGGDGPGAWVCCLPLHHVAGLAVVGRAWVSGDRAEVLPGFDPALLAAAAAGPAGGRCVSLVPTMLARLLAGGVDVGRFARILLGGGVIDPALLERARAAGALVSATYGLTETWGGVVHDGHPLPGVEVRLDHELAAEPGRGEILLRTPTVMAGYRFDPAGSAAAFTAGGELRTGDVGRFEGAGPHRRLRVVDRLRDLVKTGGISVSPSEVERVLAGHSGVADVCVAGRPDPEWGERLVAYVVPADPADPPTLESLAALAREHLAPAKAPRQLVLVEAVPRTPGGKPLRRLLGARPA